MIFMLSAIPPPVRQLFEILGPKKTYIVGGILRDSIAENPQTHIIQSVIGNDWDLATPLHPKEVLSRLRRSGITAVPLGFEHGTVAAIIDDIQYEITTFRYDIEYRDGRHPEVRFADSLEEDLQRRDFTVNALAMDIETGEIIDLFQGISDIHAKTIRTVGDPEIRFQEDYLRMLRAIRFAVKLEGDIDPRTFEAIQKNAHLIQNVSPERIRGEILKMLSYTKPSPGFQLLHQSGILRYILPELEAGFGIGQNQFHADDVAWHTLHSVDAVSPKYPFLRFITLLHDLGKVPAKKYLERKGDYVFYGHQYIGKSIARRIMRRLRFSNKEIETAVRIVENHMYNLKPGLSEGATRRFIRKLGRENVEDFLRMRMADRKGNRFNDDAYEKGLFHFARSVRKIDHAEDALTIQKLHIGGYDLIEMGLHPGPIFSQILNQLLEEVLDDPARNNRDWLLQRANEYADEYRRTGAITVAAPVEPESADEEENSADEEKKLAAEEE